MEKTESSRRAVTAMQIKEAMQARNVNRKQLADLVGRAPSDVTKWLSGRHNFTIDLLSEISVALGVQITGVGHALVDGYDAAPGFCSGTGLHDIGAISLPEDCFHRLERIANSKGLTMSDYIKSILIKEASSQLLKASDYCGVWKDVDLDDIIAHRSSHMNIEEL